MKESFKLSDCAIKILLYGAIAAIVTVLLSLPVSALILRGVLPEGQLELYCGILSAVSVAVACLIACGKQETGLLPVCLGIASVYYALLLLSKTLLFPGAAVGLSVRALTVYGAALLCTLLMLRGKKGRGARKHHLNSK